MNTEKVTKNSIHEYGHTIDVGHYGESMYYIDCPAVTGDEEQEIINILLTRNHGVGIIAGLFDEALSLRMVSGFAARLMGYSTAQELLHSSEASLLRLLADSEDYLRYNLGGSKDEIWGCIALGKDGRKIPVRVSGIVKDSENGERMWFISIRRLGEALYDTLTGSLNRYGFINKINRLKESGTRLCDCAILYINIRDFKAINSLYGSDFGDRLLVTAYEHISSSPISPLVCSRNESDKFALLVRREKLVPELLTELLRLQVEGGGKRLSVNCDCGIFLIENEDADINTMVDNAKIAKESISDTFIQPYAFFKPTMRSDYASRSAALSNFDEALSRREFKVYYQPVVDCVTGRIASAEALIRWETEEGLISPATFLPALEENGCISKLDEYVVNSVVELLHRRVQNGLPLIPISVNLSRMDFFDVERTRKIYELLEKDTIARSYVHFEITETSYRSIKDLQAEFIQKVNSRGGMVYIDDYGVDNTSIAMLSQYDFAVLKLDMKLTREMLKAPKVRILVESTILMAHKLGMKVIAEGVETEEQLNMLRGFDCDFIQGYFFSRPLDERSFFDYLSNHRYGCLPGLKNGGETEAELFIEEDETPTGTRAVDYTDGTTELLPHTAVLSFRRNQADEFSLIYANQTAKRYFDRHSGPVGRDDIVRIIHPEDRAWIWARISECISVNTGLDEIYRIFDREKKAVWVHHVSLAAPQEDGSCIFHVSLTDISFTKTVEDWKTTFCRCYPYYFEKRFQSKDIRSVLHAIDLQSAILRCVSDRHLVMYLANLRDDSFMEISCVDHVKAILGNRKNIREVQDLVIENFISPEFREEARSFYDLSTLSERLMGKSGLTMDYNATISGWCRTHILPVIRDENGNTEEAVFCVQRIQIEKLKVEHLRTLAETDGLSQLRNRIGGTEDINRYLAEERHGMFCIFDVDDFKHFNDRYGHLAGDDIIRIISTSMRECFREKDVLMRVGGDEFVIYAPGILSEQTGNRKIAELGRRITELTRDKYHEPVTISAGLVFTDRYESCDFEMLFSEADAFMYDRKRQSKRSE